MTESDVKKLQARIEELEQQLAGEREEFEWDLKAARESSAAAIRKLTDEIAALKKAGGGAAGSDRDALTQRALMAERKVAELTQEIKQAKDRTGNIAKFRSQLEEVKRRLAARDRELAHLRAQATGTSAGGDAELARTKAASDQTIEQHEREVERLRSELTATQFSQSDYDEKLAEVESIRDQLERDLRIVRKERDEVMESLRRYREAEQGGETPSPAEQPAVAAELLAQAAPGPDGSFPGASSMDRAAGPSSGGGGFTHGGTYIGEPPMPQEDPLDVEVETGEADLEGSPEHDAGPVEYTARVRTPEGTAGSGPFGLGRIWNILDFRAVTFVLGLLIGVTLFFFIPRWFGTGGAEGDTGTGTQQPGPDRPPPAGSREEAAAAVDGGAAPADGGDETAQTDAGVDAGDRAALADAAAGADLAVGRPVRSPAEQKALEKARAHGSRLLKRRKYSQALKHLVGWVRKVPDDAGLRHLYGRALSGRRRTKAAAVQMEMAIELDPGYADAYYELGGVYMKLQKRAQAREALEKFIELAPGDRRVRSARGKLEKLR